MMAADPTVRTLAGNPLLEEARERFDRCAEYESNSRIRFIDDVKFANGDDVNNYQWPNSVRRQRDIGQKPCLTMNIIKQHNLQIVNESKINKSEVKIIGTGGGASAASARTYQAIVRRINYKSAAQESFSLAQEFQVDGGIGWWRVVTDYAREDTFDQEIGIAPVKDPLSVYMDPDIQHKDGRDARFAFVFDLVPTDEWEDAYPKFKDLAGVQPMGVSARDDDWVSKDHVRVCEYFRKVLERDTLYSFTNGDTGQQVVVLGSKLPPSVGRDLGDSPGVRSRTVWRDKVEWYLIVGETVVDETEWPGKYIPLVRCVGVETTIEGILDRKGHTRTMRDAQRMYNYNASAQVEFVALQSKTPWVAPAAAIEQLEKYWDTANTVNHSVLPFKHIDDEGNPLPPPFRQEPPVAAPAYTTGMETAFQQIMMVSGQWTAQMGMQGNERTGEAINQRQAQSDKATYHFQDNYACALRFTGTIIIDLAPRIYDTKRIIKILAEDGEEADLQIDPTLGQAYQEILARDGSVLQRFFNPGVGEYEVQADVGPAYSTRREETANALTLILTQNPGLTAIVGDLLLDSLNFDKAHEAALRLRRMVPPIAMGQGPSQQEQQLQAQVQALQTQIGKLLEGKSKDQLKLVGKEELRDIEKYKAETDRFQALAPLLGLDQAGIKDVIKELVQESLQGGGPMPSGGGGNGTGGNGLSAPAPPAPPVPGAQQGTDGQWYLADPTRRGKYLRVAPLAQERRSTAIAT